MKHLLRTILLVGILCMAGCKEDEPQMVSFPEETLESPSYGWTYNLGIEANCLWSIRTESSKVRIEPSSGEGNSTVILHLPENKTYDDITFRITITSEDGTSSDVLTITQKERIGLAVGEVSQIPEGGATIDIPVKTNEPSLSVTCPDWVSLISSRALKDYTYTFAIQPNKTGGVRTGRIHFRGNDTDDSINIMQDSYAPTGASLQDDISIVSSKSFKTRILLEPEYADFSKLGIKTSGGCDASVENEHLHVNLPGYGKYGVSLMSYNKVLCNTEIERFPPNPLYPEELQEVYLGQSNFLYYSYYSKDYIVRSSNENVIVIDKDGKPRAVGYGTATVSVTHPKADCYGEQFFKVEPFLLEARVGWFEQKWDGSFDIQFAARAEGPANMSFDGFVVIDKNGRAIVLNDGIVKSNNGGDFRLYTVRTDAINARQDGYPNVLEALRGTKIMVQVNFGGNVFQRTAPVDVMTVAFY